MLDAIGETLPLAVALGVSPLAIASVVLMLLSSRPRAAAVAFLLGFAIAIGVVSTAAYLIASVLPHEGGTSISAAFLLLALGVIAIALAVRQWRARPRPGDELELPGWIAKVAAITTSSAFVMGAFFGGLKPKNLLLSIGVGVSLEATVVTGSEAAVALLVVVLIASLPIMVPVVIALVALDRIGPSLDRLRAWLVQHNAAMVGAILLLVGVLLIGKALSAFGG